MTAGNTSGKTLAGLRFAVLGAGRVGSSLAAWLAAAGAQPVRVASRSNGAAAGPGGGARRALGSGGGA
jgi:glutamate dehydrogenase/leucine dehydrogenase